ncbi:hypothetical protein [Mycobacterium sp.]|uniref:hypothetical protein n=1 Tax=Mycobacterium sp. TaxID=1785 RepID=UPI003C785B53
MANPEPVEPDRDPSEDRLEAQDDESAQVRRVGSWQRALRWVAWLTLIGLDHPVHPDGSLDTGRHAAAGPGVFPGDRRQAAPQRER